ncbi:MAG: hypothetical protein AAF108_02300 [Planctomycetota bacterium]
MADAQQDEGQPAGKGGLSPMVLGVVAVLMLVEGAAVAGFFVLAGGPREAEAGVDPEVAALDETVEIELVSDRFQNMQSNRVWLWETEVFMKVRKRHEQFVTETLEQRRAELKQGVAEIVRRASETQLREAGLETLNRQVSSYVHRVFGEDEAGQTRVDSVLIPKCRGFPADY